VKHRNFHIIGQYYVALILTLKTFYMIQVDEKGLMNPVKTTFQQHIFIILKGFGNQDFFTFIGVNSSIGVIRFTENDVFCIKQMDALGILNIEDAVKEATRLGFPVVMKVVGPVHKSDVGGVVLNVKNEPQVRGEFGRMIQIPETNAILIQPMLSGTELFAGAKFEPKFGHLVLCGMGGIFIEVL